MERDEDEAARVNPHTAEQEDEQLRRLWRRDVGASGAPANPPEGYAEENDATAEGTGWGPL